MVNISVLVSGGGTNLQALIDKVESGELAGAEIVQVISSREGVFALERAAKAGIKGKVIKDTDGLLKALAEKRCPEQPFTLWMKAWTPEKLSCSGRCR